jgi:hypothetical protein
MTMAKHEGSEIEPGLARCYEAMRVKQAKLVARGVVAGGKMGQGRASRATDARQPTAPGAHDAATQGAAA